MGNAVLHGEDELFRRKKGTDAVQRRPHGCCFHAEEEDIRAGTDLGGGGNRRRAVLPTVTFLKNQAAPGQQRRPLRFIVKERNLVVTVSPAFSLPSQVERKPCGQQRAECSRADNDNMHYRQNRIKCDSDAGKLCTAGTLQRRMVSIFTLCENILIMRRAPSYLTSASSTITS